MSRIRRKMGVRSRIFAVYTRKEEDEKPLFHLSLNFEPK